MTARRLVPVCRLGLCAALLAAVPWRSAAATPTAAELARAIREGGIDAGECYRIRNLNFTREDLKFYLAEGYLAFARPMDGRRVAAVFSAAVEGGDAEVIVMPPNRGERRSMARYAGAPNLDEHFGTAYFLLGEELAGQLRDRARATSAPDLAAGERLQAEWSPVLRNLSSGFTLRLIQDLLAPSPGSAIFFGALGGIKLGLIDLIYDPLAREQIVIGQFGSASPARFDVWSSFEARSVRKRLQPLPPPRFRVEDYRIEATLDDNLHLTCVTRARLTPLAAGMRAVPFEVTGRMRVTGVTVAGEPAEVFAQDSERAGALRASRAVPFLVVASAPLVAGREYEIEFRHEGDVVERAGGGVFYVGARESWYPRTGAGFARHDITFRYPARLTLVGTGAVVEDRREGATRITHRRTEAPIRMAGFNLGDYRRTSASRSGYTVEVYSNRTVEDALQPKSSLAVVFVAPSQPGLVRGPQVVMLPPPPPPDPAGEAAMLAEDVGGALAYMAAQFGPPPLKTLTVSPVPGTFGQGFPGLLYLSSLTYLRPEERPAGARPAQIRTFFSDILAAHETAHQWWGNLVTSASYQDDWLMEALANYSAVLYLEKRKGARAIEPVLDGFRTNLLARTADGHTAESAGPVIWGARLLSDPTAWRTITYDKGAWIIHMLRRRMGDARFFQMLAELCRRFRFQPVTTGDFQALAREFLPRDASAENFFESWVYDTGIPALKLKWSVRGSAPALLTGTVAQGGVEDGFRCEVPVAIYLAQGAPLIHWVKTSAELTHFSVILKQPPTRVVLLTSDILAMLSSR